MRQSDGTTFSQQYQYCDGTNTIIKDALSCTIPSIVLHVNDYQLPWASSIWAQVTATNIYGDSTVSEPGNGAVMYFYPDPVVNILENMADRSETTVGLTWEDGADPGGWPVEDYRITITSSDNLYNLVVTNNVE